MFGLVFLPIPLHQRPIIIRRYPLRNITMLDQLESIGIAPSPMRNFGDMVLILPIELNPEALLGIPIRFV